LKAWYSDEACRKDPVLRAELARTLSARRSPWSGKGSGRTGHVVEFLKGKRHKCGVLRSRWWRYLRVIDQNGKEETVEPGKILDISRQTISLWQPRDRIAAALREVHQRRDELKASFDTRTLWEIVAESGTKEWSLEELADLYFGDAPGADDGAALSRALDDGHLFSRQGRTFTVVRPDAVAQHDKSAAQTNRSKQWMQEAGAWLRSVADGHPSSSPENSERAVSLLEGEALFGAENPQVHEASKLMKLAHLHGPHAAFEVLVKLGHWREDENLDLPRYGVPTSFSAEATAEAQRVNWTPQATKCSRWWGGRVYGFVDGGSTDRAISIRRRLFGYTVGIHLASPALLIPSQGQIQNEAAERGASIRTPGQIVPLLPPEVASRAKLTTDEHRPALTIEVRYNSKLEMQGWSIGLRRVRLTDTLTFDEADGRLAEDHRLARLHELARRLRDARIEAGAVLIPEPELDLMVEDGAVEVRLVAADAPSRLIVSEWMILASSLAGQFCAREQLPAIYRVQPAAAKNLTTGRGYDPVACREQKRLMPRARLQTNVERHHALGVAEYVPITRASNRYTDLLMHQQLAHFVATGAALHSADELEQALLYTRCARDLCGKIEAASRRYWQLKYLERHEGQAAEAVVLDRAANGHPILLPDCLFSTFMRTDRDVHLSPGESIRVTLTHVSARRDEIRIGRRPVATYAAAV